MNTIKVKKLRDDAVIPFYSREGDAAFDLVSAENHFIFPQSTASVGTGMAFEIPAGYEVEIVPRSGISLKTPARIANSPGTIDENYRGEIKLLVTNTFQQTYDILDSMGAFPKQSPSVLTLAGDVITLESIVKDYGIKFDGEFVLFPTLFIRKGDKVAQGKLRPVFKANFDVVEELSESNRGENGFSSSGVNVQS